MANLQNLTPTTKGTPPSFKLCPNPSPREMIVAHRDESSSESDETSSDSDVDLSRMYLFNLLNPQLTRFFRIINYHQLNCQQAHYHL